MLIIFSFNLINYLVKFTLRSMAAFMPFMPLCPIVPIKGLLRVLVSFWCCKNAGFMTARMTEVEVQIANHCGIGDDHRGAVTGQQLGNN